MNEKNDITDRVFNYLNGDLSSEDKNRFEKELETDPVLQEETTLQKKTLELLDDKQFMAFTETLHKVNEEAEMPVSFFKRFSRYWYWAAAASLLFAALIFLLAGYGMKPSASELFAAYFKMPSSTELVRSAGGPESDFQKAMLNYEQEKYNEAEVQLEKAISDEPQNVTARFFHSVVLMKLGRVEKAIPDLKNIAAGDNIFSDRAQWYLALCYVNIDKPSESAKILEKLAGESAFYCEDAQELIKKLE